ncbi:hypothetical protein BGZ96_012702 [Linnemannia gamsii]|uniref:MARVEL domain-containing protein n=1 Tax=Linnemannia gamsii TaxID=64522 RepID=A0ABQ7KB35_9FUNG|nr:hypothetical protein BGZ96_012702 [Linnemannia gamsii]
MGIFDKFFGFIDPAKFAPILAGFYAVIGFVFMILSFGRWIMPHAENDLAIPWGVLCILLMITGIYGVWATTKGSTWHHRQFVSASWGFFLMLLCWGVVYIAVEMHQVDKVNTGCMNLNKDWTLQQCNDRRQTAAITAIVLVTVGMVFGIYFTLVLSRWVGTIEWAEHLVEEKRLADWRAGKGENPHIKEHFIVDGETSDECT